MLALPLADACAARPGVLVAPVQPGLRALPVTEVLVLPAHHVLALVTEVPVNEVLVAKEPVTEAGN